MRDARDIDDVTRHDIVFHQAVARTSGNTLFLHIARSFEPLMTIAVPLAWRTRDTNLTRAEVLDRHGDIARSIADRDPAAPAALMDAHFDESIGSVL